MSCECKFVSENYPSPSPRNTAHRPKLGCFTKQLTVLYGRAQIIRPLLEILVSCQFAVVKANVSSAVTTVTAHPMAAFDRI